MCTVTLVAKPNTKNGFILTSNRDEAPARESLKPRWENYNNKRLYFPKDKQSGRTWLGLSEHKRVICLLNGEFEKHERKDHYRKSRGVVVKDFLAEEDFDGMSQNYNFNGIEPFTMIVVDWLNGLRFMQLVWDGKQKHFKELSYTSHIWSSSPLYNKEMKQHREKWFASVKAGDDLNAESLLEFHHSGGVGDKEIDLIMDREFVKTQSISQIEKNEERLRFWYKSLEKGEISEEFLQI